MSVATTIQELATDIGNAYDEVQTKGGTVPQNKNTNNLATAIGSIPTGGSDNLPAYVMGTLTEINDSTITTIRANGLFYSSFAKLNLPNCTSVGTNSVRQNTALTEVKLPNLTAAVGTSSFQSCTRLTFADIGKAPTIYGAAFASTALNTLVIRKTDAVCTLDDLNAFTSTPFRNGTGGTAYVPQSLKSSYEQDTNWSALESVTFANLEGSIYE